MPKYQVIGHLDCHEQCAVVYDTPDPKAAIKQFANELFGSYELGEDFDPEDTPLYIDWVFDAELTMLPELCDGIVYYAELHPQLLEV